jgi:adenosylhomocysteine nucleosidase
MILLCCAVKEEALFFRSRSNVRLLLTGMGAVNAENAVRSALREPFEQVVTCGFAGGLNPLLKTGQVLMQDLPPGPKKMAGKFHFSDRVIITAQEKRNLWEQTQADAVEMESRAIQRVCKEQRIRCGTLRVISDAADEDLPLDLNALMTPDYRRNFALLAWELVKKPARIPQLRQFQKRIRFAAGELANAVEETLSTL